MCRQHPSSTLTDTLFPSTTLFRAPANLATDDRTIRARARLGFAAVLEGAPPPQALEAAIAANPDDLEARHLLRSEEHTSELQSLMRNSYALFCLKKNNKKAYKNTENITYPVQHTKPNRRTTI